MGLTDAPLPKLKNYLMCRDQYFRTDDETESFEARKLAERQRQQAEKQKKRAAKKFRLQLLLAQLEADSKPSGKYAIITRPDPVDYQR